MEPLNNWRLVLEDSGLKISRRKTADMGQGVVTLQGVSLKNVEHFKYLGTAESLAHNFESKVTARVQGAGQTESKQLGSYAISMFKPS